MSLTIKGSPFIFGDQVDADTASFDNFYQWLTTIDPDVQWPYIERDPDDDPEMKRALYCNLDRTHFYGVFLSAKNTLFQHFVRRDGDHVNVVAKKTDGEPPVEMNYFCLRRDSNKGIFSHYVSSYRFMEFLRDLWMTYRSFVKDQKNDYIATYGDNPNSSEISRMFSLREKNKCGPLYTPESFRQLLNRLSQISEVRVTTYDVEGEQDRPVSNKIKSVRKLYRLKEIPVDNSINRWINGLRDSSRKMVAGRETYSGTVVGKDESGADAFVDFGFTMDDYLGYDYDALGSFEANNIQVNPMVSEMIRQVDSGLLFRPHAE